MPINSTVWYMYLFTPYALLFYDKNYVAFIYIYVHYIDIHVGYFDGHVTDVFVTFTV